MECSGAACASGPGSSPYSRAVMTRNADQGGQGVGTPTCSIHCLHELDLHVLVYLVSGDAPAGLGKARVIAA